MENSKLCDMHRARRRARILLAVVAAAALAGVAALFVYIGYRPVNPQVSVARAALYQLESAGSGNNSSAATVEPYAIAARAQFTLLLHNPSDRVSVHYGGLLAYVTYHGEPAAPPVELPAVVQERGADVSLSLLFGGLGGGGAGAEPVPVSEGTVRALAADCAARRGVLLRVVVLGQVRYKSGLFRTAWRDLFVRCDVTAGVGADAAPAGVPLVEYPKCFVDA
ncbi:unnamed protein product [Urochloa decumbens]|uniref:Late embryogenesis abundant protein LEA-2 subgroup domain-containing protein n=1 Tax=Urochloa decumbens TaxID=240449 RepID=A0ABC9FEX6_9POAL